MQGKACIRGEEVHYSWWPHYRTRDYDGLARMELTFLKAACMVLCFGLVARAALKTRQCFGCCWIALARCQGSSSRTVLPQQEDQGWPRSWEGIQPAQLAPTEQRAIPYHTSSHHAQRLNLGSRWGASPSKAALPQRPAGHRCADGKWWVISYESLSLLFFPLSFTW